MKRQYAFLFPGQGSQFTGMLGDFAAADGVITDTYAEASVVLGYDLWSVVSNGPEEDLNRTEVTQPALLAAGVAIWRLWQKRGGSLPAVMAGHSLGEYTALVCAGALDFADAIGLVRDRGRYMQEAVPAGEGAMAAILGLEAARVQAICAEAAGDGVVSAANFNSPEQTVIAGRPGAVARAVQLAKQAGAKRAVPLPVSVPSHCLLMAPAAARLADRLQGVALSAPAVPVIRNVDAAAHAGAAEIRSALVEQLSRPVQWVETIQAVGARGCRGVVESAPGRVLGGLVKRIDRDLEVHALDKLEGFEQTLETVKSE